MLRIRLAVFALLFCSWNLASQTVTLEEYEPRSTLVVPRHPVPRAKYPFVDVHSHQQTGMPADRLDQLVREMDSMNMRVMVNLSGGTGERLAQGVKNFKGRYPDRFVVFANLNFADLDEPGYGQRAAARLEQDVKNGAQGLKIFKNLGLDLKYKDGRRVPTDTPDLDAVWETCARLKIPVLIHTGEPQPFFDPVDRYNERWLELKLFPQRARPADRYPSFEAVMAEQERLFARHPKTTFISAHLAWRGNNLAKLGDMLDRLPNMYTEVGAILAELGRQPVTAREFLTRYQDRVLFGKDAYNVKEYQCYFQVFETRDEYLDCHRRYHAHWNLYGLDLPDEVLKKIYYKNALKLLPGINAAVFPR